MIKKILFLSLGLGLCFGVGINPALAANPHLSLSPATGDYSAAFEVAVKIDTGGQASGGTDVLIEFPASLLKVDGVESGTAFPFVYPLIENDSGSLRITAGFPAEQAGDSFTGADGLVATITFSPLADGNTQVNFVCTPGYTLESNILEKVSLQDIIDCASNVNGTYTLGGAAPESSPTPTPGSGSSPTPTPTTGSSSDTTTTPTPTSSSSSDSTATPTLPVTGSPTVTLGLVVVSLFTLLTGLALLF